MGAWPFTVSRKLSELEGIAADSAAKVQALSAKRAQLDNDFEIVSAEMKRLPESERAQHQHVVDQIMVALRDWDEEVAKRRRRHFNDSQVSIHCREWLNLLPVNAELDEFKMSETCAEIGDLNNLRFEIDQIKRQIAEVSSAPSADMREQVQDYVRQLGNRSAPDISVAGGGFRCSWDAIDVLGNPRSIAGMMAWLFPAAMADRLDEVITDAMNGAGVKAVSPKDRERRLAELRQRLIAAEYTEENLVCALLAHGVDVVRRIDADPRAILMVELKGSAAAAA
jgi:hypothetical protein